MTLAYLQRRDPARNMARFYEVNVAPTLFGETSVVRSWGRIGTQGRSTLETCGSAETAELAAAKAIRAKLKRGYSVVD